MSSSSNAPTRVVRLPTALTNLAHLATMLEKIEHGVNAPNADQYRHLVACVTAELQRQSESPALKLLLEGFPATAQVYENLRYESAGLCLSALEQSVESEQAARRAIRQLMRR